MSGCPTFQQTVQELIEEQEYGTALGEYQLQMIRYRNLDQNKLLMFENLGGIVEKSTKIPELTRASQKRKYADHHFDNEEEEVENKRPVKISALAWHPFRPKLAVAVREYGIYFYDQSKEKWEDESYSGMGPINNVEFGPLGSCLGVATDEGVYVWRSRPSSGMDSDVAGLRKIFFKFRGTQGLQFSPCGAYIAAHSSSTVRLFSTSQINQDSAKLHTTFSKITGLDWGPRGLLVSQDKKFYLFECETWKSRSYSSVYPVVSGIATFPSSMFLFGTTRYLQWLLLKDDQEEIGIAFDLGIDGARENDMLPKQVVLSPCCSRVAIVYHTSECPLSNSVAVLAVEKTMLVPVGFVHSHADWGSALECTFRALPRGTLLTIFWASGTITFHHLLKQT